MFSGVITVTAVWNHRDRETDREREKKHTTHQAPRTWPNHPTATHHENSQLKNFFFFLSFSLALCNFVSPPSDDSHSVMCNQN